MASSYMYYNVLKMYKGTLKKTYKGNTHLLIVPINPRKYLYLAVIGQLIDEENSYACHLIVSIPSRLVESIISGELEHFGDRYIIVEKLKCEPHIVGENNYNISLEDPEEAKNIKSNLTIEYRPEFNIGSKRIYVVTGELEFETGEITSKGEMGMLASKQSALMGKKSRFEEPKTKQNIKEEQFMENSDKLKVALMGSIKESNLPKKGKLLLLDLVVENEDLDQTLEILESFSVIDETVKEKVKAWLKKNKGKIIAAGVGGTAGMLVGSKLGKIRKKPAVKKTPQKSALGVILPDLLRSLKKTQGVKKQE